MLAGLICFIEICQVKYLNNLIKQDHRFIKKITKPMMGFMAFHSAKATIDGIEIAHMIRKGQLSDENIPAYKQFMALARINCVRRLMRLFIIFTTEPEECDQRDGLELDAGEPWASRWTVKKTPIALKQRA
jgi:hypothetical protein